MGFSETGRVEEKRRMKSNLVSGLKEGKMRYLLLLLLMVAVGGDAIAQVPNIAFEPSSGNLSNVGRAVFEGEVTEGESIDIKIQSVDAGGGNPVAVNSQFEVKYMVEPIGSLVHWPFDFLADSVQSVTFLDGKTETTLTLKLRDDDVLTDPPALKFRVVIQADPSYTVRFGFLGSLRRSAGEYELNVTDNDFPAVSFKTAQSDAMEAPSETIIYRNGSIPFCAGKGYKFDQPVNPSRCIPVHTITLTSDRAISPDEGETSYTVNLIMTAVEPANDHWPFEESTALEVMFAEGEKEATLELSLTDDDLVQSPLEYELTILPHLGFFVLGDNEKHTVTWMDDDAARVPTVSFKGGGSSTVVEGDSVEITLALDKDHEAMETCPDDDPTDMIDPTVDCLNVDVEIISENPNDDSRWPFKERISPQTVSFAAGEKEAVLVLATIEDDEKPSPPHLFTLRIVPDPEAFSGADARQDYQIGTDKEHMVNWEDKQAVWLDIAPARGGFSVTPNKAAVSDHSYKIKWEATARSPATIDGMEEGKLEWDAGRMDTKTAELSYDCTDDDGMVGKVEISINQAYCSSYQDMSIDADCYSGDMPSEEDLENDFIPLDNVLERGTGNVEKTGLAEDLCEMQRQSGSGGSGGGSPGGGSPGGGSPGGGSPGGGSPGGGSPGGGSPGGGSPGGGSPGGGSPGGGSPGGDDPMDPPISDGDDPMDPEAASDSDGGCSLSGGSSLNQLASNAVAMGLVLMFGLCLVLRGGRRNVSDSLR